jgi:hypothetical protein
MRGTVAEAAVEDAAVFRSTSRAPAPPKIRGAPQDSEPAIRSSVHFGEAHTMHVEPAMRTLAWLSLLLAVGCTRSALLNTDGGAGCGGLAESACKSTSGCRADYCNECSCTPTFSACVESSAPPTVCPVSGCPALQCQCGGLDEQQCSATPGCTTNYCATCGTSTFNGCTGPNQAPPVCPLKCPVNLQCRADGDCSTGECVPPGGSACGGVCLPGCASDTQCNAGQVCDYACNCGQTTGKVCTASCTPSSCAAGEACGSDGHCAPIACGSVNDCPQFFDCVFPPGSGAPHCQRRACASDGDCGANAFCVDGGCYGALGACEAPAP